MLHFVQHDRWGWCACHRRSEEPSSGTPWAPRRMTRARVVDVSVTDDTLTVDLEDGRTISVPIGWFPRLAHGTQGERSNWQISGAGYGIHWPDVDEDIGVEGLLLGRKSSESGASFARWLHSHNQQGA